jgi:pyridoxal phosphate enzyme (YggS family)
MFNKESYSKIKSEIPNKIKILAASKTKTSEDIKEAIESGINIIGENYVQEAEEKYKFLKEYFKEKNIEFHLIGHLQSNKVKKAVEIFNCIQTLDSLKLAKKLNEEAKNLNKTLKVFIEINFEQQKSGISPEELPNLIKEVQSLPNLNLQGLMTIPPINQEHQTYKKMQDLKNQFSLKELSIGMSSDYKLAIENGSTLIRLGTILFGKRD